MYEAGKTLFGRDGWVEVCFGNGDKRFFAYKGLNFRFRLTRVMCDYPKDFVTVSILGLNDSTVERLAATHTMHRELQKGKKLRIFAGYEGNVTCLGTYDIYQAMPSSPPPEKWVEIKALLCGALRYTNASYQFEDGTFAALCSQVAKKLNEVNDMMKAGANNPYRVNFAFAQKRDLKVKGFSVTDGSMFDVLNRLNEIDKECLVYIDSFSDPNYNVLTVCQKPWVPSDKDLANRHNGAPAKTAHAQKVVSEGTGMIGLPRMENGVMMSCRTLMDPTLHVMESLYLDSKIIPSINGDYTIIELTHSGELWGNDWYTDIKAFDSSRI